MKFIDVHHHIFPPFYRNALSAKNITHLGGNPILAWEEKNQIAVLDKYNIQLAIASYTMPGVSFLPKMEARKLARECNEYSASLIERYPDRYRAFAILPYPDMEGCLAELEYAITTLKLSGIILFSNDGKNYPGNVAYEPLLQALNQYQARVLLHPTDPIYNISEAVPLPSAMIEFVYDTSRAVANLLFSGSLERYPDIKFIVAHAGGTIPYLSMRLELFHQVGHFSDILPKGPNYYLQQLYYDTALSPSTATMACLTKFAKPNNILFGSDYAMAPEAILDLEQRSLLAIKDLNKEALENITHKNAENLFLS